MNLFVDIKKELNGFKLEVAFSSDNNTMGILGASGSGKSMTLRCIAGLEKPDSGKITLNGKVLFDAERGINLTPQQRNVGLIFQNYALFPNMTVKENIIFPLKGLAKKDRELIAKEKIEMVKLQGLEERYPHQLSGGQQQRVALARALAVEPDALLLDEAFSALDNHLRNEMEKHLLDTLSSFNGPSLLVTHNLEEAYRICENLLVLADGRVAAYGNKEKIFRNPPNLISAKLTGCKNISRARIAANGVVQALDWGCAINLFRDIPANPAYIGVRAHHLSIVEDARVENTFPCWVHGISESPFEVTLHLSLHKTPINEDHENLQVNISKEQYNYLKNSPFPWYVHFNREHVFTLEN